MALSKKLMTGGFAALALFATAGAAMAAPAYVTTNVNVRSGPGTGYGVIDTLRRGEQVDVQQCSGSWCFVEKRGPDGWVSANYLDRGGRGGGGYDRYYDPRPSPGWGNYRPSPGWNMMPPRPPRPPYWGGRPQPWPVYPYPQRPGSSGSVCFNGPNSYFCFGN